MTQEDKELLLKDLCARFPYNPLVEYKGESYNVLGIAHERLVLCKPFMSYTLKENPLVEEVKPYLFPLSRICDNEELGKEFDGLIELDKIDEKKYTTKGEGHGYGLSLVKEIVNKSPKLKNIRMINDDVFIQILKIYI